MKAKIEDIKRLKGKIKDNWALCNLGIVSHRADEAEVMIAQTIRACVINHKEHGEAFSFCGKGFSCGSQNGGMVDNGTAYYSLLEDGYFLEEKRDGEAVIIITQKLVDYLDSYLKRKKPS